MTDRLSTFSRFQEPDDVEPLVLEFCCYCNSELLEGDTVTKFDDEYFCDDYCCHKYYGIKTVTLGE